MQVDLMLLLSANRVHRRMNLKNYKPWQKPRAKIRDSANKIRTTIQEGLENSTTRINLQDVTYGNTTLSGNYAQIKSQIEVSLAQAGPQNGMSAADHANLIANLSNKPLNVQEIMHVDTILNQIMQKWST